MDSKELVPQSDLRALRANHSRAGKQLGAVSPSASNSCTHPHHVVGEPLDGALGTSFRVSCRRVYEPGAAFPTARHGPMLVQVLINLAALTCGTALCSAGVLLYSLQTAYILLVP